MPAVHVTALLIRDRCGQRNCHGALLTRLAARKPNAADPGHRRIRATSSPAVAAAVSVGTGRSAMARPLTPKAGQRRQLFFGTCSSAFGFPRKNERVFDRAEEESS